MYAYYSRAMRIRTRCLPDALRDSFLAARAMKYNSRDRWTRWKYSFSSSSSASCSESPASPNSRRHNCWRGVSCLMACDTASPVNTLREMPFGRRLIALIFCFWRIWSRWPAVRFAIRWPMCEDVDGCEEVDGSDVDAGSGRCDDWMCWWYWRNSLMKSVVSVLGCVRGTLSMANACKSVIRSCSMSVIAQSCDVPTRCAYTYDGNELKNGNERVPKISIFIWNRCWRIVCNGSTSDSEKSWSSVYMFLPEKMYPTIGIRTDVSSHQKNWVIKKTYLISECRGSFEGGSYMLTTHTNTYKIWAYLGQSTVPNKGRQIRPMCHVCHKKERKKRWCGDFALGFWCVFLLAYTKCKRCARTSCTSMLLMCFVKCWPSMLLACWRSSRCLTSNI